MNSEQVKISRFISKVLRHHPDSIGLKLDVQGWAVVDELLLKAELSGVTVSREEFLFIVENNDKARFAFSEDGQRIRAVQGHSIPVDLRLPAKKPPPVLYHGTVRTFLSSIRKHGLLPGNRRDVHLSADETTATAVGARRGEPVVLVIDTYPMLRDGDQFRCADNGVWLASAVPEKYIQFPNESPF